MFGPRKTAANEDGCEIAEVVAAKQEKMLVFTQFREMTGPLAAFLGQIFGRSGRCCMARRR